LQGPDAARPLSWQGLIMIHAQANLKQMWERHGFHEELRTEEGEVEISAEPHWMEEGIEHVGMWKRLKIVQGRL
jgi:predicted GNAT family N-acyltransferase